MLKARRFSTESRFRLLFNKSHQQCGKAGEDLNLKGPAKFQEDVPPPPPLNNVPNKGFTILSVNPEFLSNPETSCSSSKMKILLCHQPQKITLLFP